MNIFFQFYLFQVALDSSLFEEEDRSSSPQKIKTMSSREGKMEGGTPLSRPSHLQVCGGPTRPVTSHVTSLGMVSQRPNGPTIPSILPRPLGGSSGVLGGGMGGYSSSGSSSNSNSSSSSSRDSSSSSSSRDREEMRRDDMRKEDKGLKMKIKRTKSGQQEIVKEGLIPPPGYPRPVPEHPSGPLPVPNSVSLNGSVSASNSQGPSQSSDLLNNSSDQEMQGPPALKQHITHVQPGEMNGATLVPQSFGQFQNPSNKTKVLKQNTEMILCILLFMILS